ncbi:MAG: 23S rRNA (uracil(1939)-C(5))-methyltransferase RlmD [Pseudanabaenaceae cyanobacterium]
MSRKKTAVVIPKLVITNMGREGIPYGYSEQGRKIYVKDAVVGDICDVQIFKQVKGARIGKAIHFYRRSALRIEPVCAHFSICGGCQWQFVSYEQQLQWKWELVKELFAPLTDIEIPSVLPSPQTLFYRNKLEFSATSDRWLTEAETAVEITNKNALGYHVPDRWSKIFQVNQCYLQPDPSNQIRLVVKELAEKLGMTFYNPITQIGTLRNVIIRTSTTGQVMVIIAFYPSQLELQSVLLAELIRAIPSITSLYSVQNAKGNDTIYNCELSLVAGQPHIIEKLGDLQFAITPKSFFQVNTPQAIKLFQTVLDFAQVTSKDLIYDLYCGTGAISLFVAPHACQVIGIELIPDAIQDAKLNAELNHITNVEFLTGDLQITLQPELIKKYGQPDLVITDPPRSGMTPKVIQQLLTILPQKIIYVSCNPVSQARDVQLLLTKYQISQIQPVDMFPQTAHVENIVLLTHR